MHDTQVWIVEDDTLLRETAREVLDARSGIRCTLAVATCEEAMRALRVALPHEAPQVVLMDLAMPCVAGTAGVTGIARLRALAPDVHVVVLTVHDDDDTVYHALRAGASGYLLEPASPAQLVAAVEMAVAGGATMSAGLARRLAASFRRVDRRAEYGLTAREREILDRLVDGETQRTIALALSLSRHTVDSHVRNIYAKLHVRSRAGAVARVLR